MRTILPRSSRERRSSWVLLTGAALVTIRKGPVFLTNLAEHRASFLELACLQRQTVGIADRGKLAAGQCLGQKLVKENHTPFQSKKRVNALQAFCQSRPIGKIPPDLGDELPF